MVADIIAGPSDYDRMKFGGVAADNLRRYVAGDRVFSVVNLHRGY